MKSSEKKLLYIFDLDGTLVDAYEAIRQSLNYVLALFDLPGVDRETVKTKVGHGDKNFIELFFSPDSAEKALGLYRQHHRNSLQKYVRQKPNARLLLSRLKRRGKKLAIASNRPAAYTRIITRVTGLDKYLDFILCADEIGRLKPDPAIIRVILDQFKVCPEQAVFIGDMDVDLETAARADVDGIYVRGGSSSPADVKKYLDKLSVDSLDQILSLFS